MGHRFAYEVHHRAPISAGVVLDHLCRVRHCVNPAHLEEVSQTENVRRGLSVQPKTHCPRNHELTPDNLYVWNGIRSCRTCTQRRQRAYRARTT